MIEKLRAIENKEVKQYTCILTRTMNMGPKIKLQNPTGYQLISAKNTERTNARNVLIITIEADKNTEKTSLKKNLQMTRSISWQKG